MISGLTQTIVKSMSDVDCYKNHNSLNTIKLKNNNFELIVPKFELDANQATVGHGRGEWAKEIFGSKKKTDQHETTNEKDIANSSSDRVSLASMFSHEEEPPLTDLLTSEDKFQQPNSNTNDFGLTFDINKSTRKNNNCLVIKENDTTASTSTIKDDDLIATAFCIFLNNYFIYFYIFSKTFSISLSF